MSNASEPREFCKEQLFHRLRGEPVDTQGLQQHKGNLENWNQGPGSQNWPRVARAALCGAEDLGWLAELAEKERDWGSWSREFGSELYSPDGIAATIAALRFAGEQGLQDVSSALVLYLRHSWALLALCGQPTPKTSTSYNYRGEVREDKGDSNFYFGPSVALAGNRNNDSVTRQGLTGALLGWALDWPGLHYTRTISDGIPPNTENAYTWPLKIVEETLGRSFGPGADAAGFGLTDDERTLLRRHVETGTEASTVCSWLLPWCIYPGDSECYEFAVRRTTEGTQSWLSQTYNPNKPGFPVVTLTTPGSYQVLHPNIFKREGASVAYTVVENRSLSTSADECTLTTPLLGGDVLYHLSWTDEPRLVSPTL